MCVVLQITGPGVKRLEGRTSKRFRKNVLMYINHDAQCQYVADANVRVLIVVRHSTAILT